MEANHEIVETVFKRIENPTTNQAELLKLKIYSKTADLATFLALKAIIILILGLFFLFLNIGFSLWLGEMLGKTYYGFFVIAALFAVAAIFVRTSFCKYLHQQINLLLLSKILKDKSL
jgi:polyferredoxin